MILHSIAKILTAALPELVPGKNLFVQRMPGTVDMGVLLLSSLLGINVDGEMIGMRDGKFQLVVRGPGTDFNAGDDLARRCATALSLRQSVQIDGFDIKVLRPLNDPHSYPISEGQKIEFSVNFAIVYGIFS
jgi:hypothetical protein